jgi:hypothetical protein
MLEATKGGEELADVAATERLEIELHELDIERQEDVLDRIDDRLKKLAGDSSAVSSRNPLYDSLFPADVVFVDLHGTAATDSDIDRLMCLGDCQEMWLTDTQVTRKGAERLRNALPRCNVHR